MTDSKVQRWIDLLAALLLNRTPVTFRELARDVPAYLADGSVRDGRPSATVKRMFERDKEELLAQGVPILTVGERGDEEAAYLLRASDFYLPYLGVVSTRGIKHPAKVDRYGYRTLETLAFEPDELEVIAQGAQCAIQTGDSTLADHTRGALRKLAFDLHLDDTDKATNELLVPPATRADPQVLEVLGKALFHRKRVTFLYHGIEAEKGTERHAEPYGLFFLNGHWYLAAHDTDKKALRNFRVSRISEVSLNKAKPGTGDYEIPADFSLRDHARSRQAWEIGDGNAHDAVVEFSGQSGAAIAAAALGTPDESSSSRRRFRVRRTDSFARWLLSLAGEATPVEPPGLVSEYASLLQRTRALYNKG
jgi:proteasome accessory factor B